MAYGLSNTLLFIGVFEAAGNQWDIAQISSTPQTVLAAHATRLEIPGAFGVLMTTNDDPQGASGTDWITHDSTGWHIEDRPLRWLGQGEKGVALVGQRVYALVGLAGAELWSLDPALGWQKEPPIPGSFGGALSGNQTNLHLCLLDQQSNLLLLWRTPMEISYHQAVLQQATKPGVASAQCALASDGAGPPSVAWFAPVFFPGETFDQNLYVADPAAGRWENHKLGDLGGIPTSMVSTPNGKFLATAPVQADDVGHLWRRGVGGWVLCPTANAPVSASTPTHVSLIQWGTDAALAGVAVFPRPQGNVTVQPLSMKSADCYA